MATDSRVKVLILGANGMLGHKLYQVLSSDSNLDVYGTVRGEWDDIKQYGFYKTTKVANFRNTIEGDLFDLNELLEVVEPNIIINCIGIIDKGVSVFDMLRVNALFPLQLKLLCINTGAKLIHISTDCVFSGKEGNYTEGWPADAIDAYGKTKWLGEVTGDNVLTIRTSLIGRELVRSRGLLEWFISNRGGTVNGYSNAIFSGFPTITMAGIIKDIILNHPEINGLYHIASEPIDKYTLLNMINDEMSLGIKVIDAPAFKCDRSLDATKFNNATGFKPQPWEEMIDELDRECWQYEKWR